MTKLVCPECQRENEPERIYCHSCGARLDRSSVAAEKVPASEDAKKTHQRIQKMFDPNRGRFRRNFFFVCKLILGAFAAAVVVEMILPPNDLPEARKEIGLGPQINFDLENATMYHRPPQLQYTQDTVNAYLDYTLKKKKTLDKPFLTFKRAFVQFGEGDCGVTVERALFGYSLYSHCAYRVAVANGKIAASNLGGSIGRMPIHPKLMEFGDVIFADVWSALDRERKLVSQMNGIEFHSSSVTLTSPPP
jgi:hypothetical protein